MEERPARGGSHRAAQGAEVIASNKRKDAVVTPPPMPSARPTAALARSSPTLMAPAYPALVLLNVTTIFAVVRATPVIWEGRRYLATLPGLRAKE